MQQLIAGVFREQRLQRRIALLEQRLEVTVYLGVFRGESADGKPA